MTPPPNTVYHGPAVTKLSSVAPTKVRWLWPDRLALGKLTLLAGDPGLGKSYLTLDLAARVSSGQPFPGTPAAGTAGNRYGTIPRKVILLSAEDDPADTIRPRLDAAGADCDHVLLMHAVRFGEEERPVNLRRDAEHLERLVRQLKGECRLVIIDPISAYLGDDEGHSNTKVRNMLAPLAKLAQDHGVAVLAVTHLNKGGGGGPQSAIYRTMGSLAFTAAARTVHLVARDPADDPANGGTGRRRLMLPVKNNLGHDRTGWGFSLESHTFADPTGGEPVLDADGQLPAPGQTGPQFTTTQRHETRIVWDPAPTQDSADALLAKLTRDGHPAASTPRPSPALDEATAFLKQTLAAGPKPAKQVQAEAAELGIRPITLRRTRQALNIQLTRTPGPTPISQWSLPATPDDQPADDQAPAEQLVHRA